MHNFGCHCSFERQGNELTLQNSDTLLLEWANNLNRVKASVKLWIQQQL